MKRGILILTSVLLCMADVQGQIKLSALPKAPKVDTSSYFMGIEYNGSSYTNYIFPFNRLVTALKDTFTGGGGSGTVTSVTAGTGLSGGTITTSGTISLPTTSVTSGNYTNTNLTVDAYGRITAASNGTGGGSGTVTSVTASAPLTGGIITSSGSIGFDYGYSGVFTALQSFAGVHINTVSSEPAPSAGHSIYSLPDNNPYWVFPSGYNITWDVSPLSGGRTITAADHSFRMDDLTNSTGNLSVSNLNGGAGPSSSTFWRGDGTWASPGGGGTVTSITASSPLTGGTITGSGSIGLGNVPVANLNSGTGASSSTFWRGDATWDAVADANLSTSNITTNNATTSKHGFLPILSGTSSQFLNGNGSFAAVTDANLSVSNITTNNATTSQHGFLPMLSGTATQFLDGTGAWAVPAGTTYSAGNGLSLSSTTFSVNDAYSNHWTAEQAINGIEIPSVSAAPSTITSSGFQIYAVGSNKLTFYDYDPNMLQTFSFKFSSSSQNSSMTVPIHDWIGDYINAATTTCSSSGYIKSVSGAVTFETALVSADISDLGSSTVTFTNKWFQPRVGSSSSTTPSFNCTSYDEYDITSLAGNITSVTISGTPVAGQMLVMQFTAASGSYTINWGTSFESGAITLPTTITTVMMGVALKWNAGTSKWRCAGIY